MNASIWILIAAGAAMFLVIGGLSMMSHHYTLGNIKSRTVGDGQHGNLLPCCLRISDSDIFVN